MTQRLTHDERRKRRKQMASDYLGGMSFAAVAVRYGVTESSVRLACKLHIKKRGKQ